MRQVIYSSKLGITISREELAKLSLAGNTTGEIAQAFGTTRGTVNGWFKIFKIRRIQFYIKYPAVVRQVQ